MKDKNVFNPFSLFGKRILVTGATSGLGKAIAQSCARMGAEMIVTGRDQNRLAHSLEALFLISDLPHMSIQADLTVTEQRAELVAALDKEIDGLVHSAGISQLCPVRMITTEHLYKVQAINVEAPVMLTQALLKKNLVNVGGSILFISSIAAHIGVAGVSAYSGTKAALIAISRCLAMEVVKRRIRVNCLSPALVETSMLERISVVVGSRKYDDSNYPLGFGKPDDVANAAIFMLSDASLWITGTTLVMDGGLTIS
ncbi:SDR family oxidoreductase [Wolbachia endosymbiont of Listronotus oregonensis]|uniref:SDR family NAD(P)-dependent oxidoreductase n=1 Tax=unclassified Wolbachia TaxID=2640676 RepID=UPI00222EBEFE|nr:MULTISPECIES: SDR family oxidoreductase [unclassified Wolbachia]WMT84056.1 SDR family oxidoreductase [Wolbachia endosymbiont of Listronotus oregonensis]